MKSLNKSSYLIQRVIAVLAVILLVVTLIPNYFHSSNEFLPQMKESLPQASSFNKIASNPLTFEGISQSEEKVGYVVVGEGNGYGGPLTVVTGIGLQGDIVKVVIANHKDTPSFIQQVVDADYLKQFKGKKVSDPLSIHKDIDSISGATLSSKGISQAIAQGSHAVAKTQLGMNVEEDVQSINFTYQEIIILGLIVLALLGMQLKQYWLRWVTLIGGLISIGFMYNSVISLGNIAGVFMGYFPPIKEKIYWYLLLILIPALTFLMKKNFYCSWICPFGAAQEITAKLGGGKFHCRKEIEQKARKTKYILAYAALLFAFIYKSPTLAGYEPFPALFARIGNGVLWFILPIVILASLFIRRFWCNYFCPVGVAFELLLKCRRVMDQGLKKVFRRTDIKEVYRK